VGYEEGGQLTEQVRRRPYSVILFDEIEKAHPEIFNVLLQILDDGRLTDAQGRAVDFKNAVLIMTSNVGAPMLEKEIGIGFRPIASGSAMMDSAYERMKEHITDELRRTFRPEFLNRIDEVIIFRPLTSDQIRAIVSVLIARVQRELRGQSMTLELTEAATDLLAKEGYDPTFGARPLRRAIQRLVEDNLSDELLRGNFKAGDTVVVDARNDTIVFEKPREPALKGD
jgi:ATP-dependent Clp protease ATP-binding subunit ClpC